MSSIIISILVVVCIFAGGLIGLSLNRVLRPSHLTKETQEVVRLGIGMISVLSSLVLGLLIATAKNSYDTTASAVRTYAAELALLNETLRDHLTKETQEVVRRSRPRRSGTRPPPSRCAAR